MSTDLMNIEAFKGMVPATAFAALDPTTESLADGIGSSYGVVGYKGKVWTLRLRGETYQFNATLEGGARVPAPFLDVIILRSPPYKSKSYYPPGTYQDGQLGTRPVCAALDGNAPDADIMTAQATACAICPKNVFKLNAEGRKSRDCADYKRLAVLILPRQSKEILGAPLMEPVFLRVPAASLNELAILGERMEKIGFHYSSYITRIGFVADKPHPQMTFSALQGLTNLEAPLVMPMREDANAIRITGENEVGKPRLAAVMTMSAVQSVQAAPVQAPNVVQMVRPVVQPVQQAIQQQVQPQPQIVQPLDTGFGAVGAPATVTVTAVAAPVAPTAIDTGFGSVGQPVQQVAQPQVVVNTVADTGPPEDADQDLDARVAALLPKD